MGFGHILSNSHGLMGSACAACTWRQPFFKQGRAMCVESSEVHKQQELRTVKKTYPLVLACTVDTDAVTMVRVSTLGLLHKISRWASKAFVLATHAFGLRGGFEARSLLLHSASFRSVGVVIPK